MPEKIYTPSDLVQAYNVYDPAKAPDIPRILAALDNPNQFTLAQLQAIGAAPPGAGRRERGMTGLSGRSTSAWQQALSWLGTQTRQETAVAEAQGQQFGALESASGIFQEAISLARERAALGKRLGGQISQISKKFLEESTPLRKALIGSTERALGLPVTTGRESPVALFGPRAPERQALESQFGRAREAIMETSPARGGQLARQLSELPIERARAIGAMEAAATDKAVGLGLDIGLGSRPLVLGGLATGAGIQTGNLGGAAGTMLGAGAGQVGVASGYSSAADRSQQYLLGLMGFQTASAALAAQERMRNEEANAAKKAGTGQGVGAGVGGIGGGILGGLGGGGGGGGSGGK